MENAVKNVLVALVAGAVSLPALAQVPVFTTSNRTYQPLTLASPGFTNTQLSFSSTDDSATVVTLPFPFPWFGASYSSMLVQTNGFVSFNLTQCTSSCYFNAGVPTTLASNSIYGWWDDLRVVSGGAVTTHASPAEFVVQYSNVVGNFPAYTVNFQIRLSPSGTVIVHYGPTTGSGGTATVGFSDPAGTQGARFMAAGAGVCNSDSQLGCCGNSSSSSSPPACVIGDIVNGLSVRIGEPLEAELTVPTVTISNLAVDVGTGNWTFDLQATIRNLGLTTASSFTWSAYLSTDQLKDASDQQVAQGGPITIGPTSPQAVTGSGATTTAPATGAYYILVVADDANVVSEALESNNVGASATQYISGTDLVAASISGVARTGGGNVDTLQVSFANRGTVAAASVAFRLLLSTDTTLDASDFPLGTFTRSLTGGQTITEGIAVTMPVNVPSGDFYYVLQLDPADAITEATETNNVVMSTATALVGRADLIAEAIDLLDPVTGATSRVARFGEAIRVTGTISNPGPVNANNFHVGLVVSADENLSLLSDSVACEQVVPALNAGALHQTFTINCTLPLMGSDGKSLTTGSYYLYFLADSRGQVFEALDTNNNVHLGPVRITAPGADLTVSNVTAPAAAGVGEVIPVVRTIRNLGNVDAPAASYRYFASANDIITAQDIPLAIVAGPGTTPSSEGSVTLAHGSGDTATELVQLPSSMPAGSYFIGCIVDPASQLSDLDRTNNGRASRLVQVAGSSLRIMSGVLPDATIGRPYLVRLAGLGEEGPSTWTLTDQPAWLSLNASDGLLSGTPTGTGADVSAFTVALSNAGRQVLSRLVLRTLPATAQLEVTTIGLPSITNSSSVPFSFSLGAAGGVRPYAWRVAQGSLPSGLVLSTEGVLGGAPRGSPNGTTKLTVEVRDPTGGRAQREFSVRLVSPGSIRISKTRLPDALVGSDFLEDIAVSNADMSPLAKPLSWSLTGALPDGLALSQKTEIATISGRPAQAGLFSVTLTVEDANGRTDSVDYVLVIHPPPYKVIGSVPEILRPLQNDLTVQFGVAPANQVTYSVVAGALPPGLALSAAGLLSGTIAADADGQWNFVVQAKDAIGASGLAAFSTRVESAPKKQGCSSTGDFSPLALLTLAGLLMRRRFALQLPRGLAVLGVALAIAPAVALAQYQVTTTSIVFQPLGSGGLPAGQSIADGTAIALPFDFPFYATRVNTVTLSRAGYLAVGGSTAIDSSNETIPHDETSSFSARAFIAPWWDSLGVTGATYRYAVVGAAPARVVIVEWTRVPSSSSASATPMTFQARLYEGSGRIQFAYDVATPSAASASVGIQSELGNGVPGLTCSTTATCGVASYPPASSIDFFLPPDLEISSLSVPQTGYAGVSFPVTAIVLNSGGRQAANVDVTFYLSTDAALDVGDTVLGTASTLAIEAGATAQVTSTAALPAVLTATQYFVIAKVDPTQAINEQDELNNTSSAVATAVGGATADLVATTFTAPATTQPGAMLQVSRAFRNSGNADAPAFKYSYFLSDNSAVTVSDRALSPVGQVTALAVGATDTATDTVVLPTTLAPGNYWLGVCANYDSGASRFGGGEITIVNNCLSATAPVQVSTTEVAIVTISLPAATQYAPWGLRLQALGGTGQYTWGLAVGSLLPVGLTLSADGVLQGAPAKTGTFSFEVKVTSGALTATKGLSLVVTEGSLPLVVVDQLLSAAQFGRSYKASLIAVGGKPPYAWALQAQTLPQGLALASDGTLEGRADEAGDFPFSVEVTDSSGAKASKALSVSVVTPSSLAIATRALPEATLSREYVQPLVAVGGRPLYQWSVVGVQQLAENLTEQPSDPVKEAPAVAAVMTGLGLTIDGSTQVFLRGVPKRAGLFLITLGVVDGAGTQDSSSVLLHVGYVDGLQITTTSLPDAFLNREYSPADRPVKLSHNGGREAEGITFAPACVKQATRAGSENAAAQFTCAPVDETQTLPPGLVLGSDGLLTGMPTASPGTYTFLVKLTDSAGRQDVRALSIRVLADSNTRASGCAGVPRAPSMFALVALLGLAWRRRRL